MSLLIAPPTASPMPSARVSPLGRRVIPFLAVLLVPALLSASVGMAAAATLDVPANYPTIQAAVTAAAPGDTVVVADGTYSGAGNRDIDFGGKSLTVQSASGDPARTIIDCGGAASADGSSSHRGFYFHSGETGAVVSGLTVENGYESAASTVLNGQSGGGICVVNASPLIQNCAIKNCTVAVNTTNGGGGVYDYGGATKLVNCTISGNSGVGVSNGTGTLSHCVISDNLNGSGGGVFNYGEGTVTGCTITGNTAANSGGGVYNIGTLINCTISGNTSAATGGGSGGGGVYEDGGTLTSCTVSGNSASGLGGGVFIQGPGTLTNCLLVGNTAAAGGGVFSNTGTMTNCTVTGNTAQNWGGFYNNRYASGVTNCIFYGDTGGEIGSTIDLVFLDHCDVQGGYSGGRIAGDSAIIDADPLFVSAAGGDLHLQAGSPCIGAGTSNGLPTTDKDGKTRPSPPTIGAYEGAAGVAGGHTHLLWNNADGRVMLWSVALDGSFTLHGFGPYTDGAPQNKWSATAVATGANGRSHILWNNTDGRVMLWTVDDAGNFIYGGFGPYTDDSVGRDPSVNRWHATALSVGPDEIVHILWNNTDGRVMLWNVEPSFSFGNVDQPFNFTLAGYGPYTDTSVSSDPGNLWSATALSTGPDNVSHILWNNVDHRVMLWDVDSSFNLLAYTGYGPYTDGAPQNKWSVAGVSVGPDNVQHILWTNTDHRAMFWDVNPDFSFTLAGYGPYTDNAPQNLWSAAAVATGPDNLSHILWGNTDYRAMLWGVDNSFSFTVAGYGPYTDNAPGNPWSATAVSAGP